MGPRQVEVIPDQPYKYSYKEYVEFVSMCEDTLCTPLVEVSSHRKSAQLPDHGTLSKTVVLLVTPA